jgi:NADH:ubiquinone oxidoreductase subunit 5 (subunit L)/multisubunit Na+/H+ antiporter MnhA subunit
MRNFAIIILFSFMVIGAVLFLNADNIRHTEATNDIEKTIQFCNENHATTTTITVGDNQRKNGYWPAGTYFSATIYRCDLLDR